MKTLKIELPEGHEIDKDKSTFEQIVFKEIEDKLPTSVDEIEGRLWYIDKHGEIKKGVSVFNKDDNNLSTKERAEAFLALMQLVELRDAWNGDWRADFSNSSQYKYCIIVSDGLLENGTNIHSYRVLHFHSRVLRDEFLNTFKDLIETAKELI